MSRPSSPVPVVIPEVLPPEPPAPPPPSPPAGPRRAVIEPLAALALVVVDNLWLVPEFAVVDWPVTIPLCFLMVSCITYGIQRRRGGDSRGAALVKALILGAVAAVPWSVTGTPVGLALFAWAGLRHPWKA